MAGPDARRRLTLLPLAAATFFIVSGGPYGLEEVILGHGYAASVGLILLVPLVWSLPVALMVGELASALPETGGFYVWVRRGLGPRSSVPCASGSACGG
jgi:amino acid transporter